MDGCAYIKVTSWEPTRAINEIAPMIDRDAPTPVKCGGYIITYTGEARTWDVAQYWAERHCML